MDPVVTPITTAVAEGIISRLLGCISRQIGYLSDLNENVESLKKKMSDLMDLKRDVVNKIDSCEREGMECRNIVKGWLDQVESVQYRVDEIDVGSQQSKRCLQACDQDCCSSRYRLGKNTVEVIDEVSKLILRGNKLINNVADIRPPPRVEMIPTTSVVVGADLVIKQVLGYLKGEDVRVIALYGMGGIGKTTILEKINNDLVGNQDFDFNIVIFVSVNKDVEPIEIQKAIYKRLALPWSKDETIQSRKGNLYKNLHKSKYLLLLDNMWGYLNLVEDIGVPEPTAQNKCKVVFTTRKKDVCSCMGTHKTIKIEVLGEVDAWNLFQKNVGDWVLVRPLMLSLAKEVAKKCEGLPLALITVGRAMASKKMPQEWRNVKRALYNSVWEVEGMDIVFSCLKYSYDCLKDDATKSCFLYCSFFPESSDIKIKDVIRYWIGEGFFYGIKSYTEAYDMGWAVLCILKKACLLESDVDDENNYVKMHDVVRDMALQVASELGKKPLLISKESSDDEWNEAERVFLIGEGLSVLPKPPKYPNLSTLILSRNLDLKDVAETFFENMLTLRVVDLSRTGILSMPRSLSLLANLRYLNLSHTQIKELPMEIGKLSKLQNLDLSCTQLESLPQALGDLHSLEHLNLEGISTLQTIPHTTISKLSHLKELNFIHGFRNWELKERGDDDGIGVKLEDLESFEHLRTLGITIENNLIFQRLFESPFLLKCTKHLEIKNLEELSLNPLLLAGFAEMGVLHELRITSCARLGEFIIGFEMKENFLGSLYELHLRDLPNLNSIWKGAMPQGCLGNLCVLSIFFCYKLKSLRWVHNLPCLKDLSLCGCHEIKEVLEDDEVNMEDIIFPKLRNLTLIDLPKPVSFYHRMLEFPSLVILTVHGCPQLKKLPLGTHSERKLEAIYGGREWWEALVWEDQETKNALLPLFQQDE